MYHNNFFLFCLWGEGVFLSLAFLFVCFLVILLTVISFVLINYVSLSMIWLKRLTKFDFDTRCTNCTLVKNGHKRVWGKRGTTKNHFYKLAQRKLISRGLFLQHIFVYIYTAIIALVVCTPIVTQIRRNSLKHADTLLEVAWNGFFLSSNEHLTSLHRLPYNRSIEDHRSVTSFCMEKKGVWLLSGQERRNNDGFIIAKAAQRFKAGSMAGPQ